MLGNVYSTLFICSIRNRSCLLRRFPNTAGKYISLKNETKKTDTILYAIASNRENRTTYISPADSREISQKRTSGQASGSQYGKSNSKEFPRDLYMFPIAPVTVQIKIIFPEAQIPNYVFQKCSKN